MVYRRVGGKHPEGLVAVSQHHGVSDLHLVLHNGVHQPGVEGVDPEDADPSVQPPHEVLVVVASPVQAAVLRDHAWHRTVRAVLRD